MIKPIVLRVPATGDRISNLSKVSDGAGRGGHTWWEVGDPPTVLALTDESKDCQTFRRIFKKQ